MRHLKAEDLFLLNFNFTKQNMMKKFIALFATATLVITISSCSHSGHLKNANTNPKIMTNVKWYLSEVNGKEPQFDNEKFAFLTFDSSGKIQGNTGCNLLNGIVSFTAPNQLHFSNLSTTRMACRNNTEADFLAALNAANNWKLVNQQLVLSNNQVVLAKLNAVSLQTDLLSGNWELFYISGPKISFEGLYPEKKPSIFFNFGANTIHGNTSCNGFTSKYKMDAANLTIEDGLQTMRYCEGGGEQAFQAMMKKTTSYKIEAGNLVFYFNDVPVLKFKKQ